MTNDQIKEVSDSKFVNIGSHGWYHNNLSNIDLDEAKIRNYSFKKSMEKVIEKNKFNCISDGSYTKSVKNNY